MLLTRAWRWAAIVGGAVVVALVLSFVVVKQGPRVARSVREPMDAADRYLSGIRSGDLEGSYQLLCDDLREQQSLAEFRRRIEEGVASRGRVLRYEVTSASIDLANPDEATVGIEATTDRQSYDIAARLREEDGGWRWCGSAR